MGQLTRAENAAIDLARLPASYGGMVERINSRLPAIRATTQAFGKAHSQFMLATLDITQLTPVRAVKHVLAEIEQTRAALREAYIRSKKTDIERRRKVAALDTAVSFDRELIEAEIEEIDLQREDGRLYIQGAVRKLSYLVTQYDALLARMGKTEITEADYEAEEARYHVMTCLKQALCAARARGGVIDEGNFIYLFDMGLPAAFVQQQVLDYLKVEQEMLAEGKAPTHDMTIKWLEDCADALQHFSAINAERRGFVLTDPTSLHQGAPDGL